MKKEIQFQSEADLCRAFIEAIPDTWIAYPETGGFDILLIRKNDGFQIGVEAKLKLNAKVVLQAAPYLNNWREQEPDCRAILIPHSSRNDFECICSLLGVEVISVYMRYREASFTPSLPDELYNTANVEQWFEWCPAKRLSVPGYIPDCEAGHPSPVMLTAWKVKAIKIATIISKVGYVTREDFKYLNISMPRWVQGQDKAWLKWCDHGKWEANKLPDFKTQHPRNYQEIFDDYETWKFKPVNPSPSNVN